MAIGANGMPRQAGRVSPRTIAIPPACPSATRRQVSATSLVAPIPLGPATRTVVGRPAIAASIAASTASSSRARPTKRRSAPSPFIPRILRVAGGRPAGLSGGGPCRGAVGPAPTHARTGILDRVHPFIERLGPVRAFRELRRDFSSVVFVLAAGDLVASFGFSLIFPFLTIYLVQRFGASAFQAGLVLSGYSVCSIFSGAVGGWLADRIGRRIVMIVSVGVTGGVVALMGQATDLTQIALLTVALGLIDPAFIPAARAAIADVVPEDRRPRAYGLLSVAASVGWIAGPAIGAGLASLGYALLFSVAGAIIALYAVIGWIWLPETRPTRVPTGAGMESLRTGAPAATAPGGVDPQAGGGIPQPEHVDPRLVFVAFLPIALVVHAATFQWVSTLPIHAARDLGMPTSQWGLLFSLNGILIVLFQMRVSGAAERRSKPRMMALASLLYAAGYAVVGPVGGPTLAIAAIAAPRRPRDVRRDAHLPARGVVRLRPLARRSTRPLPGGRARRDRPRIRGRSPARRLAPRHAAVAHLVADRRLARRLRWRLRRPRPARPPAAPDGRPHGSPDRGNAGRPGAGRVTGPRAPHPANELNELPGEEWLYFTKSVLVTAYPSELGHALRKRHGANKPPRLMARLIEFFTKSGELVLDPFAGVGGTLLGAAIARRPRRALGIELDPRWAAVYRGGRGAGFGAERGGAGAAARRPRAGRPGRAAHVRPGRLRAAGRRRARGPARPSPEASVDFVATDPPYTVQMPLTMAGGRLAEAHANRRTDYAMVTDDPADLANAPTHDAYLDAMEAGLRRDPDASSARAATRRSSSAMPTRTASTASPARSWPTRAARAGLVPKGDLVWYQAGTRLRPYGYPRAFVPNIAHQHIVVLRREPERPGRRRSGHGIAAARRRPASAPGAGGEEGKEDVRVDLRLRLGGAVYDHLAEGHPVEPALPAVRGQDAAVGAVLLEDRDLVALVERADLEAQQLVGPVEEADDPVADPPPLACPRPRPGRSRR